MTNIQILYNAALEQNAFTETELNELIDKLHMIPLFSFQQLKAAGLMIRKGQHARVKAPIWIPKKKTNKNNNVEELTYFSRMTAFFTIDQTDGNGKNSNLDLEKIANHYGNTLKCSSADIQTDENGFMMFDENELPFS